MLYRHSLRLEAQAGQIGGVSSEQVVWAYHQPLDHENRSNQMRGPVEASMQISDSNSDCMHGGKNKHALQEHTCWREGWMSC